MSIHNFFMKLTDIKTNEIACIKELNIKDRGLKLRLMEMGFVKNTKLKIIYKNKDSMILKIRDYDVAFSTNILDQIEVI